MKEFNMLCKEFELMDGETYTALLAEKAATLIPALTVITQDGIGGVSAFATFIFGAVAADGRLSEEEYLLLSPLLKAFFGDIDYEDCKKAVRAMHGEARELKQTVDVMADILGLLSDDLKNDVILVCLMICAIDGKVSHKEKQWIKQLIR